MLKFFKNILQFFKNFNTFLELRIIEAELKNKLVGNRLNQKLPPIKFSQSTQTSVYEGKTSRGNQIKIKTIERTTNSSQTKN